MTFKHVLLGAAILAGTSATAFSATEYFNQAAFQTAITNSGQNPLAPLLLIRRTTRRTSTS